MYFWHSASSSGQLKHIRKGTRFSMKLLVKENPNMGSRLAPRKTKRLTGMERKLLSVLLSVVHRIDERGITGNPGVAFANGAYFYHQNITEHSPDMTLKLEK